MVDITGPEVVEVVIRHDGTVVWVNVDGVCRLRCSKAKTLIVEDQRTDFVVDSEMEGRTV